MPDSGNIKLHIISLDVPYPADYGGMIDVFFTLKYLAAAGVDIFLHCFQYGRSEAPELEQYCREVWYYPRKTGLQGLSLQLPYILYSRRDEQLLKNLLSVEAPILYEGIHCCYTLNNPALKNRKKVLRNHNVEQQYYALLAERAPDFLKKIYFKTEAKLLRRFENQLHNCQALVPISEEDTRFFQQLYPDKTVSFVAGFHPFDAVVSKEGKGNYCLYQGNLSHPENIEVALFLINEVFAKIDTPLIIAGRKPDATIALACKDKPNISLIPDPDDSTMSSLIEDAHIQVLPTFQKSGLKLKLLYALYSGRFVLVNNEMLYGTGLDTLCTIASGAEEFKHKVQELMARTFSAEMIEYRKSVLQQQYNNRQKAEKLLALIRE